MRHALLPLPLIVAAATGAGLAPAPASAQATCFAVPDPVVSLSYGSRYTDESEDRSDLDEEANAAVDAALEPIDTLITDMASAANKAVRDLDAGNADCVIGAIRIWAEAEAMSDLKTMNAQLSSPSRVGAFALAYMQAAPLAPSLDEGTRETIETWLADRAHASAEWFDEEAPPMASQNNLRAWAGLAAAAAGRAANDEALLDWAAETARLVACQADEDGALPMEMSRGPRALHYHLHAVAPLVTTAAMLETEGYDLFETCDGAIRRAVSFVPQAFENPALVNDKAGEEQLLFTGEDELKSYELAWAVPYLAHVEDPALADFVAPYRPLSHSKLGGSQDVIW